MNKFILVNIENRNCTGMFLQVNESFINEADKILNLTMKQGNDLLKKSKEVKIQLRIKINTRRGKKNFTFNYHETKTDKNSPLLYVKSFKDLLDIIDYKRLEIKEKLKSGETLRTKRVIQKNVENSKTTFLDKADEFLKNKGVSKRKATISNYKTGLLLYSKELHDRELSNITIEDIQKIVYRLIEENKAPSTVTLFARTLGSFFKSYQKEILLDLKNLELPEIDNKIEYKLAFKDTKRIIKALREYSRTEVGDKIFYKHEEIKNVFAFSLTGRRISEVLNLKFSDLNFETNTFKVPASTAKGKKELEFIIDEYLLNALKSQSRLRNIDLYSNQETKIFSCASVTPRRHFHKLLEILELPILRLHDIRHMLATTLVQNGVAIQDISRMLGHSSISITEQRYAKTNKEQATRATNAFNSLME